MLRNQFEIVCVKGNRLSLEHSLAQSRMQDSFLHQNESKRKKDFIFCKTILLKAAAFRLPAEVLATFSSLFKKFGEAQNAF